MSIRTTEDKSAMARRVKIYDARAAERSRKRREDREALFAEGAKRGIYWLDWEAMRALAEEMGVAPDAL